MAGRWQSLSVDPQTHIAEPSAQTVDTSIVVGWAAMRAGFTVDLWSDRSLLLVHVRAMRPHYAPYVVSAEPREAATSAAACRSRRSLASLGIVWMIMHVVYVEAEFGLWQLSPDQLSKLIQSCDFERMLGVGHRGQ